MTATADTTVQEQWRGAWLRFADRFARATTLREEGPASPRRIDERLVQAIWHDQLLRRDQLITASGKRLEIHEPGRWNNGRGPDFEDARITLAGQALAGDVEIHVPSNDWTRHGHHQDYDYNRVVLHVVLFRDDDRPYDEKQNGERLERLVLEDFLEPDLDTIRATINLNDYPHATPSDRGLCHEEFLRLDPAEIQAFLLAAGRARIEEKIARFAAQARTASLDQLVYQSILTAQGYKGSKTLYFLLAKRTPFAELVDLSADVDPPDRTDFVLSILLNVGNLLSAQRDALGEDDDTAAFRERLDRFWRLARPYYTDRLLPPTRRWFAGVRPAGFPTRRLTAVAQLVGRLADPGSPLLENLFTRLRGTELGTLKPRDLRRFWRDLAALLVVDEPHYFSTHFTLGGKPNRHQSLLGEPAAFSLLFNVFLPIAITHARGRGDRVLEQRAWDALSSFPALEKNSLVRFMQHRLFGEEKTAAGLLKTEIFQQAMFKVFHDCCAQNDRSCVDCTFLSADRDAAAPGAS